MYDDINSNQGFNQNDINSGEHKEEDTAPDFVRKDLQSQPVQSGVVQPQPVQPQSVQPQPASYQATQPQPAQPQSAPYQSAQPRPVQPQSTPYQSAQPSYGTNYQNMGTGNRGTGYQQSTTSQYNTGYVPPKSAPKAAKKKNSMAGKAAGITAAALLFGVISGGTMVGINMIASSYTTERYPQVSKVAIPEETQDSGAEAAVSSTQTGSVIALDVSAIVKETMPSVVAINNTMYYESSTWFGGTETYEIPSSGSGIIIGQNDDELLIVTNNHVVADSGSLSVVFIDDTSVEAAVKGTDYEKDLAVIAVPLEDIPEGTFSQISIATMGNSDELQVGQGVIAIGNALGYGQSVTVGYVSALDREIESEDSVTRNLLQTDAAINPGNSGGALLNMRGEVIGINAAKYSSTDVEGMGYAIPISQVQDIINNLITKKTRIEVDENKMGYLGIQGSTIDTETARQLDMPVGIFVYKILEGGAASETDLREKDIITRFDDQSVTTMAGLQEMLKYYEKGETVELTVHSLENGAYIERVVSITLGEAVTDIQE